MRCLYGVKGEGRRNWHSAEFDRPVVTRTPAFVGAVQSKHTFFVFPYIDFRPTLTLNPYIFEVDGHAEVALPLVIGYLPGFSFNHSLLSLSLCKNLYSNLARSPQLLWICAGTGTVNPENNSARSLPPSSPAHPPS